MAGPKEKRVATRITTVVPVNCRVIAEGSSLLPSQRSTRTVGDAFSAKTVNVSHSGMLINCDIDLVPGSRISVSFNSPSDGRPARIIAVVAWSRRNAMNLFGRYASGLTMDRFSEKDRAALADFFKPL